MQQEEVLLDVKNLVKYFPVMKGLVISKKVADVKAVDDISFFIRKGETLGMVGESGCGKTTAARTILQLYRPTSGQVVFEGTDLATIKGQELRQMRRRMQMIFQDPYGSLNPRMSCGSIIGEPLIVHKMTTSRSEYRDRVAELLTTVGLNTHMANRFPHEFSGGQRQRIGVARALAVRPNFIACDEPVSALDVSIQAQLINLLEELQQSFGLTYLFVAHDLSVVRHISDRIVVMYLGKIAEIADRNELYENPLHPYTKALLSAVPIPDPIVEATRERIVLTGDVPSPLRPPPGCVFHPRCPVSIDECTGTHSQDLTNESGVPYLREVSPDHWVSCIRV
ncbi:ATP-binding cassette domain-containing protein [SAR202 cluster bacterium AC-647-N09_OGT_505m]|nr:ATP-binding cassette domain-containing protein [SAR202 cluster bacterium AC-647-N09_OGT_505m]